VLGKNGEKYIKKFDIIKTEEERFIPPAIKEKIVEAFLSSCRSFRGILLYLLTGAAIGAIINGFVPQEFIVSIGGKQNSWAVPVSAVIAIPLYIRIESAISIGVALLQKGMSIGAVMSLIIGGAGMAIPEITLLLGYFKLKLVVVIVSVIFLTAVIGGHIFNIFF
jgi:uncharacterized membrane protein YraQ (UPF0718 family)